MTRTTDIRSTLRGDQAWAGAASTARRRAGWGDEVTEGQICWSIVGVPGGPWSYCAHRVYVATRRADGVLTWRADERGQAYRSRDKARRESGLPLVDFRDVRHGSLC